MVDKDFSGTVLIAVNDEDASHYLEMYPVMLKDAKVVLPYDPSVLIGLCIRQTFITERAYYTGGDVEDICLTLMDEMPQYESNRQIVKLPEADL